MVRLQRTCVEDVLTKQLGKSIYLVKNLGYNSLLKTEK